MLCVGVEPTTYYLKATYFTTCATEVWSYRILIFKYLLLVVHLTYTAVINHKKTRKHRRIVAQSVVHGCVFASRSLWASSAADWSNAWHSCLCPPPFQCSTWHSLEQYHLTVHPPHRIFAFLDSHKAHSCKSWPLRFHSSFFQSFSLSWRFADLNLCSFRDTVILEVRRSLLQGRPVCWSRMATRFKTTVD